MKSKLTKDFYNKHAGLYKDASENQILKNELGQIQDFCSLLAPKSKILDVGCGSGRDSNIFYKKGFSVVGIDISENLLALARQYYSGIEFIEADMTLLPFENNIFDGLWVHASLLHLTEESDIQKALSEFSRVTKSGGAIHIFVRAQNKKHGVISEQVFSDGDTRIFRNYKVDEIVKFVEGFGFNVLTHEKYNETRDNPKGRSDIDWIVVLAKKVN